MRHEKSLVSGKFPAVLSSQRSRFTSSFPPDERSTVNENFLPVTSRGRSDIVLPENFEENEERISKTTQSVVSFGGEGVVSRCLKQQCQCSLSPNAKWMVHLGVEKQESDRTVQPSVLSSVRSKRLRSATVATEEDFEVRRVAASRRKLSSRTSSFCASCAIKSGLQPRSCPVKITLIEMVRGSSRVEPRS